MVEQIPQEELLQKSKQFKEWSGPMLCRIFNRTHVEGYEIGSLGSGGFLKYKNRFFVITAEHVLRDNILADILIPYGYQSDPKILTLTQLKEDKENDIAVVEIKAQSAQFMQEINNRCFLEESLLNTDPFGYYSKVSNVVFLHGVTAQETNFDYENRIIEMTTTPYITFIDRIDEASERIVLMAGAEGISENGESGYKLPEFNGMSGSFVYSYRRDDDLHPFRCLGVLSNGSRESGFMWVIPIGEVIEQIEQNFF